MGQSQAEIQLATDKLKEAAGEVTAEAATVTTATAAATAEVKTEATSEVAALKAKIAALETSLQALASRVGDSIHNRLNEVENTIKRKFPYG